MEFGSVVNFFDDWIAFLKYVLDLIYTWKKKELKKNSDNYQFDARYCICSSLEFFHCLYIETIPGQMSQGSVCPGYSHGGCSRNIGRITGING